MHMVLEGIDDHLALPKRTAARRENVRDEVTLVQRAPRRRVTWEEPCWLQELIDKAGEALDDLQLGARERAHARAWTRDKGCLASEAPVRITQQMHASHQVRRYSVRQGDETCGQWIACTLCGAYAQLRNAGMSAVCTPTAGRMAQLERILKLRHPKTAEEDLP
eukprot:1821269-Amphidinium_carterae.3